MDRRSAPTQTNYATVRCGTSSNALVVRHCCERPVAVEKSEETKHEDVEETIRRGSIGRGAGGRRCGRHIGIERWTRLAGEVSGRDAGDSALPGRRGRADVFDERHCGIDVHARVEPAAANAGTG